MAKSSTKFICQQCGFESVKWMGKCPDCGEWNSFAETVVESGHGPSASGRGSARVGGAVPVPLTEVQAIAHQRANTGSPELDRVLGGGLVPGSLVLLGGEPGIGKCVTGDTRVLDPVSGALLPIVDWAHESRPVLALDETTHGLATNHVTAFHDQGVREIVEVTTRLGHTLRCTPSHPVLTPDGWKAVGDLSRDDRIAAPRALPYFGHDTMTEERVKLIGYILSDGSATDQITVTSAIPEVEPELRQIADHFGMTLRVYDKPNTKAKQYRFVVPLGARGDARRELGSALNRIRAERGLTWLGWAQAADVSQWMIYLWGRGEATPSQSELLHLADAAGVPVSALAPDIRDLADMVTPIARFLEDLGLRFSTARTKVVPASVFTLTRPLCWQLSCERCLRVMARYL